MKRKTGRGIVLRKRPSQTSPSLEALVVDNGIPCIYAWGVCQKDENNYLKAQNEDLRGEIAYLKSQLANNSKRNLPTITQDDNLLSKQKSDEAWEFLSNAP